MTRNATINHNKMKAVGGLAAAIMGITALFGAAHTSQHSTTTTAAAAITTAATNAAAITTAAADQAPAPVAGLDQTQMNNAKKIVDTAKSMGLDQRAQTIAIATAMQESNLHNLASTVIPESQQYTDEGQGSDHDSVGLFQQRQNWGNTKDLMTPQTSAHKFLQALQQVPGWHDMPLSVAAQKVQVSAYPDAYAKHEAPATQVVHELNK